MTSLSDFDDYCVKHGITPEEAPMAFARWLDMLTEQESGDKDAGLW